MLNNADIDEDWVLGMHGGVRRIAALVAMGLVVSGCGQNHRDGDETDGPLRFPPNIPLVYPQTATFPPLYTVQSNEPDGDSGLVFIATGESPAYAVASNGSGAATGTPPPAAPPALEILDKQGHTVFFDQLPAGLGAGNFRVQTYRGQPVLTWFQGVGAGNGFGTAYIADTRYRIIKALTPAGLTADVHEFRITSDDKALITSYQLVPYDLSSLGGPKDGLIDDVFASIVDIASGKTEFEWDALKHIPVSDTVHTPNPSNTAASGTPFDPYHINSIYPGPNGDLLISLRHTSTIYDVDTKTGNINWQLRGQPSLKGSTFALGDGVEFAFQHDAQFVDPDTVRLINNNSDGTTTLGPSSAEWIHLDKSAKTATLVRNQPAPAGVQAIAMGNAEGLPNGNTFIGWGASGVISEFSPSGKLLYQATTPGNDATYRAYLQKWSAQPPWPAEVTIDATGRAHAVWNGATDVKKWRLLAGASDSDLKTVATVDWNGFDTAIALPPGTPPNGYFQVEALGDDGRSLTKSAVLKQ